MKLKYKNTVIIYLLFQIGIVAQNKIRVIEQETKRPIENAIITINGEDIATDNQGFFNINSNLPDSLFVSVNHVSYNPLTTRVKNIIENNIISLDNRYTLLNNIILEEESIDNIFSTIKIATLNKLRNDYYANYYWQEKRYINDSLVAFGDAIFTFSFFFKKSMMIPSKKKSRYTNQLRLWSSIDMTKIKNNSYRKQPSDRFIEPRIGALFTELITDDYSIMKETVNDSTEVFRCKIKEDKENGDKWSEINIFINSNDNTLIHSTLILLTDKYKSYYEFYYCKKDEYLYVSDINWHIKTLNNKRDSYIKFKFLGDLKDSKKIRGVKTNKYVSPFMLKSNYTYKFWENIEDIKVPTQFK